MDIVKFDKTNNEIDKNRLIRLPIKNEPGR